MENLMYITLYHMNKKQETYKKKSNSAAGAMRVEANLPVTSAACTIFITNAYEENV